MFLKSLKLKGVLSFRDTELELRPLNVLIGPNGSGKSNLIEVIGLLQALPRRRGLIDAVSRGGGVREWLWRGRTAPATTGSISTTSYPNLGSVNATDFRDERLLHTISFREDDHRLAIDKEHLEGRVGMGGSYPVFHVRDRKGEVQVVRSFSEDISGIVGHSIGPEELESGESVLSAIRDPLQIPVMSLLAKRFESISIYRDLGLGPSMPGKGYQTSDRPSNFLEDDAGNLNLILQRMELDGSRAKVEKQLQRFYETTEGLSIQSEALSLRLFLKERGLQGLTPVNRLSDGTIRYLCLLAILCHPDPPPLICIEEPEIGLHPDILHDVAGLLLEASERTQLIVTTHSDILIDALSGDPESVVVCERDPDMGTSFERLSAKKLNLWLEDFKLGEIWRSGEIGGVRW